jgi:hypothetical protein
VSENVFDVVQMGAQSGSFNAPGSAVPATLLFPVEAPINIELDRASTYPKQDRGRNARNTAGQGYHGLRGSSSSLPGEVAFEDIMDILEMHFAGGVVPSGSNPYTWLYPFEADAPTIVPRTIQNGNKDSAESQARMISALVDSLTIGFEALTAPGAYPWTLSASLIGLDRDISALTAGVAGTNEVQTITITATGGTFTLSFLGVATGAIAFDATGATIQTALRAISSINGAHVTVAGAAGGPHMITFIGNFAASDQPLIVVGAGSLTGGTATLVETTKGVVPTAVAGRTGRETVQGHLTRLYEGTTGTAFASLTEIAGSLKSYTQTTNRNLARRAYGSSSDQAVRFGFSDMSTGTFEANVGISPTAKSDFHDIWNAAAPAALGERRWRVKAIGTGTKVFQIDARVGIMAVPFDDVDGERVFKVTGEFVDDSTLGAPLAATIVNAIATL